MTVTNIKFDISDNEQVETKSLDKNPRAPEFIQHFISHLTENELIHPADGKRAIDAQKQTNERIDVVLTELGIVPASELLIVLSKYFSIPLAVQSDMPDVQLLNDVLPIDFLRRNTIIPISLDETQLTLAIADPFASDTLAAITFLVDKPIQTKLAKPADIEEAINRIDTGGVEDQQSQLPDTVAQGESNTADIQRLKDIASEAPVIRYLSKLISQAVTQRASDVHLEPLVNGTRVRFRIDGVMLEVERIPVDIQAGVISRIKILARLNIAERRLPQDGRAKFVVGGNEIDLRVSTMPTLYGESTVLRVLDPSRVNLAFPELGFEQDEINTLNRLFSQPNGILLITGPTGSGKTTTLYTALKYLNSVEKKIFTVEDPVEYELAGLNQIQIHPQIGLDFAPALRSILRQDPDIVMIGEMRDLETVRIGVQAALTGHLVLSTLHTNSAPASIMRLLDIGAEDYLVGSALNAVAAQRLVRTLCKHCAKPSPDIMEQLEQLETTVNLSAHSGEFIGPHVPIGCNECNGTGFLGRTTIFELLEMDEQVRKSVRKGTTEAELRELAIKAGMTTLLDSGVRKVLLGKTTLGEVFKAATR